MAALSLRNIDRWLHVFAAPSLNTWSRSPQGLFWAKRLPSRLTLEAEGTREKRHGGRPEAAVAATASVLTDVVTGTTPRRPLSV